MFTAADHRHMASALRLAAKGLYTTDPNPRVGCVLVKDEQVIASGWHREAGGPHAEVVALNAAGDQARGATAYVTLEPCSHHGRTPPCAEALIKAGVARVVCAMEDPSPKVAGKGFALLREAGIEVLTGLMAPQAAQLNPGFISRFRLGRPYVRCKLAMSLDGRTAMASGESRWITSEASRADVQRLRARSSAIVTGSGTVLADDPRLNVRLEEACRPPVRVIMDSNLVTPPEARMLALEGETWIATRCRDGRRRQLLAGAGARLLDTAATADGAHMDPAALLEQLAREEINEVLVEAGPRLSGAFLAAGLIDELIVYMAPHLMGDGARGLFHLPALQTMDQRLHLRMKEVRQVDGDLRLTLEPSTR